MIHFFAPTRFEVPLGFHLKTESFGIGKRKAEKLVEKILLLSAEPKILIFGCAGALKKGFRAGEVFEITTIRAQDEEIQIPQRLNLPGASLATSRKILKSSTDKETFQRSSGADLVDMEMEFIWKKSPSEIRDRLIFVRGVFDDLDAELRLNTLKTPLEMLRSFWRYQTAMKSELEKISSQLR